MTWCIAKCHAVMHVYDVEPSRSRHEHEAVCKGKYWPSCSTSARYCRKDGLDPSNHKCKHILKTVSPSTVVPCPGFVVYTYI